MLRDIKKIKRIHSTDTKIQETYYFLPSFHPIPVLLTLKHKHL